MIDMSCQEKRNLISSLNWDYHDKPEDMLALIEGRIDRSGAFTREKLFLRSLERLPWHYIVALWGVEAIKQLYTPALAGRIWPKTRRRHFDFALAVLRGEPVSTPGWGFEYFKSRRHRFFSNRGNGA
jgi:hypothetical protein